MTSRVAATLALSIVVVALVKSLSQEIPLRAGANGVAPGSFVYALPRQHSFCQSGEVVRKGTTSLRLTLATYGEPTQEVRLSFTDSGRQIAHGNLRPGWSEGTVDIPIRGAVRTEVATLCLRNAGESKLALAGETAPAASSGKDNGRATDARLSAAYFRRASAEASSLAGVAIDRMGHGRGDMFSSAAPFAAILLAALTVIGSLALILRGRT